MCAAANKQNIFILFYFFFRSIFIFVDTVLYIYINSWTIHRRLLSMCDLRILHGRVAGTILHHIYTIFYVYYSIGHTTHHIHFDI